MLEVRQLTKTFGSGDAATHVLKGIDLTVHDGEFLAIMGRSGAGKSTLMYQMSLLDTPTLGQVILDGKDTSALDETEKALVRLKRFGYVFQDYALLPELTALENVILPILMEGISLRACTELAVESLRRVGLEKRLDNLPSQLSGGEQQRVSISRAMAHRPDILFADEPTANLDRESSATVMDIFKELNVAGQTIIMVTHEEEYGRLAHRLITIDEGRMVREEKGDAIVS
jgi:putative ABC transport system ATP-binding protein